MTVRSFFEISTPRVGCCEPGRVKIDRDVSEPNQFLSTFCSHPKLRDCIPDCHPIQVFINCCTLTTKPIHLKQQVGIMQQNFGKDGRPRHTQQHQPSGRVSATKQCKPSKQSCAVFTADVSAIGDSAKNRIAMDVKSTRRATRII